MKEEAELLKETREGTFRRSSNKRYYREDFSGLHLANADFRYASVIECKFIDTDLSYANFQNANCWGSVFEGTNLYRTNMKDATLANTKMHPRDCFGMTITLTCDTVEKMDINEKFWLYWLFMGTMMRPPTEAHRQALVTAIGEETYEKLQRLFKQRQV